MPSIYYRKELQGLGDGSSWGNAKSISTIKADLAVQPATTSSPYSYFIGSPRYAPSNYFVPSTDLLKIDVGGSPEYPLQIQAGAISATVSNMMVDEGFTFYGNRELPWQPGASNGSYALARIAADNVEITGLRTVGMSGQLPAYRIAGPRSNVTIQNHISRNEGLILRIDNGQSCTNLRMTDCAIVGATYGGLYFGSSCAYDSYFSNINILLEAQDGREYSAGVFIGENNNNLVFDDVYVSSSMDSLTLSGLPDSGGYVQGDGFIIEDTATNITINRGFMYHGGDGGYDVKSDSAILNDCVAIGWKYCYRIWGSGAVFMNPVGWFPESRGLNSGACFEAAGGIATITNPSFKVDRRASVRHLASAITDKSGCVGKVFSHAGRNADITINGGEIETNGLPAFIGNTGSKITLTNVLVNGINTSISYTFATDNEQWSPA